MSHHTRDYTGRPVLDAPQLVLVRQPQRAKCEECGGDAVVRVDVSETGSGFTTDHLHARTCSVISCPHGKLNSEPCEACYAAEEAARLQPMDIEAAVESLQSMAYTDSGLELDERKLRQCLVDDVGATGTAMLSEAECDVFVCGDADDERQPGLKARFPKTDAWLEEQLT
jgi:hypothetical protein